MAYSKQTWTNDVSKLNATRMQHIEDGLETAALVADGGIPATLIDAKGDLIVGSAADTAVRKAVGSNDTVVVADSSQAGGIKWVQIGNAQVVAGAAIAYSKLNLGASIVNADIASAAAIALSKLAAVAWSTYVPVLTGSSSNPTLGSASSSKGRYMQIGKTVIGQSSINVGGSGFSNGSGDILMSLPVNALAPDVFASYGSGWLFDSSATGIYVLTCEYVSSTKMQLRYNSTTTNPRLTYAAPVTIGQTDILTVNFTYEAS